MGKYKYGKPDEEISLDTFKQKLEASGLSKRKKAYLILFSRGKRGQAGGPSELRLNLYGLPLVVEVWNKTRKKQKLFPFCDKTAYNTVKQLYPHKTPHWFRYNRVTKLRKKLGDTLTIDEIKSFTGIRRDTTIQDYGLKTRAGIHKVAQQLD